MSDVARRRAWPLAVAVVTAIVFLPAFGNQFVLWDDDANFLTNTSYRGLAWDNIRWMLTSSILGHWIPVTWLTLGLDYVVWGMDPTGYHLTNILLHALNAALFYCVARRLLAAALGAADGRTLSIGAAAAALFWALHPLRVESVAWVTERRDVVSGALYLLTVLTYLVAAERAGAARARWLAASLAAYALALMSKSIVMTLPVVLLVLDVYPLRRLPASWRAWGTPAARAVWLEKAAYGTLAVAGAATALVVLTRRFPLTSGVEVSYAARPAIFLYDLAFYLWKTAVPYGLIALYELPRSLRTIWPTLAAGAAVSIALTVAFVALRRRVPAGLAVWVAYAASVAPVGGLVHNGGQIAADRYTYLACLGWALLVGGTVTAAARGHVGVPSVRLERALLALVGVWLAGLAVLSAHQTVVWTDSETLWRHALAVDADCAICENRLGAVLANAGRTDEALVHLDRAVTLRPDRVSLHADHAVLLFLSGRARVAVGPMRRALLAHPDNPMFLSGLGVALLAAGQPAEAEAALRASLARRPNNPDTLSALGFAAAALGRRQEALGHFRRSLELAPASVEPRVGIARTYLALGRVEQAAEHIRVLRRLAPSLADDLTRRAPLTRKKAATYN